MSPFRPELATHLLGFFEVMSECFALYTLEARVLYVNPATIRNFGKTADELVGRVLWEVYPDAVGNDYYRGFQRAVATGEPQHFVYYYPPFGRAWANSIYREGAVVHAMARDVTLEWRANQRLSALSEAARESERRKDEFLAMLGHELRNPLAPILTAVELMRLRGAHATYGRELDVIHRQIRHAVSLVDDLLDVSRIARGKIQLRKERTEIARVVAQALDMARSLVNERRHAVVLDVPERGLCVDADPSRLCQVVVNLVTNAARYMDPGGEIAIAARAVDSSLELRVRDRGPGIDPALLPQIFESFVQGPRSFERREGGLGLGLYIVHSLVTLHGGRVDVQSTPGAGAEFVVTLPLAPAGEEPVAKTPSWPPREGATRRRVLVVDDNEDAAETLARALTAIGAEVRVASDPLRALETASTFAPEAAILDIGLPLMDGWELGRRLRMLPGLSNLRLIAVSGYGQDADQLRSVDSGFDGHFTKPVELEKLVPALR